MSQGRALRLLALSVLLFGGVWPVTKDAMRFATPMWFGCWRAVLAGIATILFLAALGKLRLPRRGDWPALLVIGGLQIGAFFAFMHAALAHVPSGRAALIGNVTLFWLVPLAVLLLGERVSRTRWAAAGLGFAGVFVMVGPWAFDWSAPGMLLGHALMLAASLSWSVAILVLRRWPPRSSILGLLPWAFALAGVMLAVIAAIMEPGGGVGPGAWLQAVLIGVVAAPLGTWATTEAGRSLNAVLASIGFLLVPIFGIALGTLWLGEPFGWDFMVGGGLIAAGVLLAAKG
ncbi:MAG: DMT family transporter [Acetobacteraceae bacterium]|nr:DMT family transporter [Acetobacteraceae bacterium]